jgi:hypothetical protein
MRMAGWTACASSRTVAGHLRRHADGRPISRDEAGRRRSHAGIDHVLEGGRLGPIGGRSEVVHAADDVVEGDGCCFVVDRAGGRVDDQQELMWLLGRARRLEDSEGLARLEDLIIAAVVRDGVGRARATDRQTAHEQPDRQEEPQADDRPAMACRPRRHADGPRLPPSGIARILQTRSTAIATEPPPPRHSVASPYRPSRRSSSCSNVAMIRAPLAPIG